MSETLEWLPALDHLDLVAAPVADAIRALPDAKAVEVTELDPADADTEVMTAKYGLALADSGNCVVVAGRRGETTTFAACVVLATTRADVNGVVRKRLDARKASFAPLEAVVEATAMEYGGITPVGLPSAWPLLLDAAVAAHPLVIVGGGVRGAKLRLPGEVLAALPNAEVVPDLGKPG